MTTRSLIRSAALLCLILPLCLAAGPPQVAVDWLTKPEREFFLVFGRDVSVGGKTICREPHVIALAEQSRGPLTPIRDDIAAIVAARGRMLISPADLNQLLILQRAALADLLGRWTLSEIAPYFNLTEWDRRKLIGEGIADNKYLVESWKLQASWIERGLDAHDEANAALARIADRIEARTKPARTYLRPTFRVVFINHKVKVMGSLGPTIVPEPVVRFTMQRNTFNVKRVGATIAGAALLQGIGLRGLSFEPLYYFGYLAAAQEKCAVQPIVAVQLLPTVDAGQEVAISLMVSPADVATLQRIDLKVWTGSGCFEIFDLPGLAEAREAAIADAERERLEELQRRRLAANKRMAQFQRDQFFSKMDRGMAQNLRNLIANSDREQEERIRALFGQRR